jgi:putative peptide zinc metalloprotease protein
VPTDPLFSASWYRVAGLQPRLRSHARIHRQRYRGQTWYVLEDRAAERFHRFSPAAYQVIGLMDGRRTVELIWEAASSRLGDDGPTQDEVIRLLAQLHASDVLQCEVTPDAAEVLERHERGERRRSWSRLASFFSWRFPLVDPERFLTALAPVARPLWGWPGALLWLAVVVPAAVLLAAHWHDLTGGVLDRVLAPGNLVVLWLVFPAIKALHELGHAFAVKVRGGEVHDMGLMLLVLTPVPYVDASAAWGFRDKRSRIVVGAAGMLVELFLAAIALYVWIAAEPGLVRVVAFNTILIAGVSTVLFNANPLLRYDGYYILSDWLEIPNLRSRANAYLGYLSERYLFGRKEAELPPATRGERAWFVIYAVTSFVYRIFVVIAIVLFLGDHLFLLAVVFAAMTAVGWLGVPVAKGLGYLVSSPRLRAVRVRAIAVTCLIAGAVVWLVGFVPVPYRSRAEGVIWIPEEATVRATTDGFVQRLAAAPGSRVRRGDVLLVLRDPALVAQVRELEARRAEVEARLLEQQFRDLVKAELVRRELLYVSGQLAEARARVRELTIRASVAGTFVVPVPEDLPGRFVRKGEVIGYTVELGTVTVRAVVHQDAIDLVRHGTERIDVRLAERLDEVVPGVVRREVPGVSERLPASALGTDGGGQVAVDPRDQQGVTAMERVLQIDVELPATSHFLNVGGRAYLRFDHGRAPLAQQWYQHVRQVFLSRFNV